MSYLTAARKTRFRLLARLYRVGLVTHSIATKSFSDIQSITSPFPKLPGASFIRFIGFQPVGVVCNGETMPGFFVAQDRKGYRHIFKAGFLQVCGRWLYTL